MIRFYIFFIGIFCLYLNTGRTENRSEEAIDNRVFPGITEENHDVVFADFNPDESPATLTRSDGTVLLFTYYPSGLPETVRSSDNSIFYLYVYDSNYRPVEIHDLIRNRIRTFTYDSEGRFSEEEVSVGIEKVQYRYDSKGRPIAGLFADGSSVNYHFEGGELTEIKGFDADSNLIYCLPCTCDDEWRLPAPGLVDAETEDGSLFSEFFSKERLDLLKRKIIDCSNHLKSYTDDLRFEWSFAPTFSAPFQESLEEIGKFLWGSYYPLTGYFPEKCEVGRFGEKEIHDKVRISFINGILTTKQEMLDNLTFISGSHEGVKIHYVFRATRGWVDDVSDAIMIKFGKSFGYRSEPSLLLAGLWKELIAEIGGPEGGGVIVHYAHSLGGTDTDRARTLLSPEEQKMIRVVTLGSSTLVRNEGFQNVTNHVSANDGVPLFSPLGHIRHLFEDNSNVYFHGKFFRSSFPMIDHMFERDTYKNLMISLGREFLKEFRID